MEDRIPCLNTTWALKGQWQYVFFLDDKCMSRAMIPDGLYWADCCAELPLCAKPNNMHTTWSDPVTMEVRMHAVTANYFHQIKHHADLPSVFLCCTVTVGEFSDRWRGGGGVKDYLCSLKLGLLSLISTGDWYELNWVWGLRSFSYFHKWVPSSVN